MSTRQQTVVDELLGKPSTVSPTLFVGLGGCGCRMVNRIAEHLERRPDIEKYRELVKFALVDTNINDLESYRERADETFLISDFEKEQYANLAAGKLFLEEDDYFTQWVPPNYRFRAGDTAGAGQIRIESRLGIYYQMKHKDMVPRLRRLLEGLKSHLHGHRRLDSAEIRIVLCYSVAGGTGSGSHLPLAYTLRDLATELGKPWLIGVAVLPSVFEDKTGINKDGTFANGYAALKETEHLMKLGAPESRFFPVDGRALHYNPSTPSKRRVHERPFEYVYVIDKPESFSVSSPVDAAADGLYLQFFSPLLAVQNSDYDNYTQHQRFLVPHDFEGKGILGFTSYYGSFGTAVMLVPASGLVQYCGQAAALSLMRSNFLRDIPGDNAYHSLRSHREPFDEVTLSDEKEQRPIHIADFVKKEPQERNALYNRLFMKRIRLLAHAEQADGSDGRFLNLFRHGHRLGTRPTPGGNFEIQSELVKRDREKLASGGMKYSIGAIVLEAVAGGSGEGRRGEEGLLRHARQKMEEYADANLPMLGQGRVERQELQLRATTMRDDFRAQGLRVMKKGYKDGTIAYPGLDNLLQLGFLKGEAGEVDLSAKRYAVLRVLQEVQWERKVPPPEPERETEGSPTDRLKAEEATAELERLRQDALDAAMNDVRRAFLEGLSDFRKTLQSFAEIQRKLEMGFENLEREQSRLLDDVREQGDISTEQYILDVEALTIEDGRRMWDFYYEDQIANLPELSLSDKRVQQLLSDTVTDLSVVGAPSTSATLNKLFDTLREYAKQVLRLYVDGDPKHSQPERRNGLTLSQALELEVVYRALYLSDPDAVKNRKDQAIRSIIASYRTKPPEEQIDLNEPRYRDYLRDKVKRAVKEKASLLCLYEEARDHHGGVRPDHVALAAIDQDFENTTIAEALRGAEVDNLQWVSTGWHNPKEIIFYRAVLNVPLYVFGRLPEMKDDYYRFKNLAKRSKVLHIDRNWEESLTDLDPDSAKEQHRQKLMREQIISFAALLTMENPHHPHLRCITRQDGNFYLTDPTPDGERSELDDYVPPSANDHRQPHTLLGESFAKAIARLPEVLEKEAVKYAAYQQAVRSVHRGLSPRILQQTCRLPIHWRRTRDDLRTKYGSDPDQEQRLHLKDLGEAFQHLHDSLLDLQGRLNNQEIEQRSMGTGVAPAGGSSKAEPKAEEESERLAQKSLKQSIQVLETFHESWRRLEHPEDSRQPPKSFLQLFQPLDEKEFADNLEVLRNAVENLQAVN